MASRNLLLGLLAVFVGLGVLGAQEQIVLEVAFEPDPEIVFLETGQTSLTSCGNDPEDDPEFGYLPQEPSAIIEYTARPGFQLHIWVVSNNIDTVLKVETPRPNTLCDDDSLDIEFHDSHVWVRKPLSGLYRVYVGTYGPRPPGDEVERSVRGRGFRVPEWSGDILMVELDDYPQILDAMIRYHRVVVRVRTFAGEVEDTISLIGFTAAWEMGGCRGGR